jgi:exopolyphosphatase/guanosine-5'-triphosphate,3'-diphosphate pyrophosphatase
MSSFRSAVVDIGSNSVRMVAFDSDDRSLEPIFNERAMSGLGRDLLTTGKLHPGGCVSALAVLARFRLIASTMGIERVCAVATAAAREASDGGTFIEQARTVLGSRIDIIPGEEEARLSALGVICGIPSADGVIADLGGGSLEIAEVAEGIVRGPLSLPLGPLALGEMIGSKNERRHVNQCLAAIPKGAAEGRALYLVGGAWRSLAKNHVLRKLHPIRVIHQYALPAKAATNFARSIARTKQSELPKLRGISRRRRAFAPYSARLILRLIERLTPDEIVFSGYGLREGIEYDQMSAEVRAHDPLLEHCRQLGQNSARVPFDGDALAEWTLAAFQAPPADMRIIRAAAWLSDMSGSDHPDYRGQHAAMRAMHLASAGINHEERVFLAATLYARYHGYGMEGVLGNAVDLMDDLAIRRAVALGMTFRLAHAIEPGDQVGALPGLRSRFRFNRNGDSLELIGSGVGRMALGETAVKRLAALSEVLGVSYAITEAQSAAA